MGDEDGCEGVLGRCSGGCFLGGEFVVDFFKVKTRVVFRLVFGYFGEVNKVDRVCFLVGEGWLCFSRILELGIKGFFYNLEKSFRRKDCEGGGRENIVKEICRRGRMLL